MEILTYFPTGKSLGISNNYLNFDPFGSCVFHHLRLASKARMINANNSYSDKLKPITGELNMKIARKQHFPRFLRSINLIVLLVFITFYGTLAHAASVNIDRARWNNNDRLIVKGSSDTLNLVFLSDSLTGTELATVQADDDGNWVARIKGLSIIPCYVRAVSAGSTVEKKVRNTNGNCSSAGLPVELTAKIYTKKLCSVCHADDGSGVTNSGGDIQGKSRSDVQRAIDEELVHSGIDVTPQEIKALVAFLDNPVWPLPVLEEVDFSEPDQCKTCHPRQFDEWSGNMMAYSALSPTFSALEALGNDYSISQGRPGFAAGDHATAGFCQSCHNPADTLLGNVPTLAESNGHALRDFATKAGRAGISCDICHQISGPDTTIGLGRLGDGIANTAFVLEPGETKFGPLVDPEATPTHSSAHAKDINMEDGYLRTGEFCGTCHDVRTPPDARLAVAEDPVTGEPFQRLENLFTEWKNGPYGPINNSVGGVVTCQDCHMDLGPPEPAGTYAEGETTVYPRPRYVFEREEVRTHYFTGIDIALVDFPGQDDDARDENGNVIGQVQRRRILMESAAQLAVSAPSTGTTGETIPIMVHVTNSGTGHNLPSGFSQERQIWVELIVSDNDGTVVYESGTLVDTAHPETGELLPDGNLDDEDLRNLIGPDGGSGLIDPVTLEANVVHGPDYNQRHGDHPVNKGLANFGNEFIRFEVDADGVPMKDADGHFIEEEVLMPFLSTHTDNSFSIPALETVNVQYDVQVPADISGLNISARLRARAFPPRFLRALAAGRPDLVNEKMVDRNRIVEMVSATPVTVLIE